MQIYLSYLQRNFEEKKKEKEVILFEIRLVINGDRKMKFPHRDDAEHSCHVSGNHEGL